MNKRYKRNMTAWGTVLFCFIGVQLFAQCGNPQPLLVQNPSFEGPPQPHITPSPWTNCQPGQTPDTQPGSWGISLPPTNGSTYLGLVNQVSANWQEGASQQLSTPMQAGMQYTFTIDLANSSSTGGGIIPGCAECQIWGGNGACGFGELLWASGNITPYDTWITNTVTFTPTQNWPYITIYVHSLGCTDEPYILVDNMSPILPASVAVTTTVNNNVSCANGTDGLATANIIGQNPPFTYQWNSSPVQTDTVLDNVPAGTYTITVTDANTCTATTSVVITEPQALILTPTANDATCFGTGTGSAYMSYSGGTAPMNFVWNDGTLTQNDTALFAGVYTLTVTDAHNCSTSTTVNISEPAQLVINGTVTNVTCMNGNDGSINTTTTGGTAPYSFYEWNSSPVQNTPNAIQLTAANYSVTVTDTNACTATASFTVTQPPNGVSVQLAPTPVLCYGESTGSVTSTVTGGSPAYTYLWNTVPPQSNPNLSNLPEGTYEVTVTDSHTCTVSASATVHQPPTPLTATLDSIDVLCYGTASGSILATASGGIPGYTYNWNTSPPQNTATAINLLAGNYTVTVSDSLNCTFATSATVNQPAAALAVSESHVDVLCYGDNTGSATAIASGGTTGYTYQWNSTPPQSNAIAANLTANTYTLTVTDANNCTATVSSVISQPAAPLSVTINLSQPLCFGQPNAEADAIAAGGTSPYVYVWNTSPPQNSSNLSNIPGGTYTVSVTDAHNCTVSNSIVIAPPPTALTLSFSHVDVLCYGEATGSVTVIASGSYGNYNYNWNTTPAQSNATAAQLIAGTYSVTVSDTAGCSATGADTILQPSAPLSLSASNVDVLCFGDATGSATVIATGGTAGYNYSWSTAPPQNTATASSLLSGNYTVTVTDAHQCTDTAMVFISQPATPLAATSTITNIPCHGMDNGIIAITTTGGTTAYSYQWSLTPSVNSSTATNLSPGNYSMTVTDANNCSFSLSPLTVTEPTLLTIAPVVTNVSCPLHGDGSIISNPAGGSLPYTFIWNNSAVTEDITNLNGGAYALTVTDNHGCTVSDNFTVTELPGVSLSGVPTNVLCFPLQNGAVNITVSSSFMPLQFDWSNGATSEDIFALDTGLYSITVTDAHGCEKDSSFYVGNDSIFSIDATPDATTIDLGQSVTLNVNPIGSSFGAVLWTPPVALDCYDCISPSASPIQSISYLVTGTDVNGCIATDTLHITVVPKYVVYVPNAFTPNGDGSNDYFEVYGNKEAWKQFHVAIFNRLGEMVYESNDMNFKWDGRYKGVLQNPAVFVYLVKVVYLDNYSEKLFKGSVTLLR